MTDVNGVAVKWCFDCGNDCDVKWLFMGRCPKCDKVDMEIHIREAVDELEKARRELKSIGWHIENAIQHLGVTNE